MNWYKRSQQERRRRLGDPYIPEADEFEFLTGKDPNEQDQIPGSTYQPGKRYVGRDNREPYNVPTDNIRTLLDMDLNSLISEIEETIKDLKGELKNPNLSTRSKKIDIKLLQERSLTKDYLNDYIFALKKELSFLKKMKREVVFPDVANSMGSANVFQFYYKQVLESRERTERFKRNISKR